MTLSNTGVIVTGASRGLGAALAREIAKRGARVVLVARPSADLERVVDEIRSDGGVAYALAADVGDKEAVYPIAGAAAALVGPIDAVIHNASTLGKAPLPLLLDTECEDFQRTLDVNLVGPFRLTKALAGSMLLRGSGLVVHVTSDASVNAYAAWGMYGVSKAALDHLARIWAEELAGTGVRFLSIDPGEMNTEMHRDAMPDADPNTLADPGDVARRIVTIIEQAEHIPTGGRIEASNYEASGEPVKISPDTAITAVAERVEGTRT